MRKRSRLNFENQEAIKTIKQEIFGIKNYSQKDTKGFHFFGNNGCFVEEKEEYIAELKLTLVALGESTNILNE